MFKAGDLVRRKKEFLNRGGWEYGRTSIPIETVYDDIISLGPLGEFEADRFELEPPIKELTYVPKDFDVGAPVSTFLPHLDIMLRTIGNEIGYDLTIKHERREPYGKFTVTAQAK